MIPLIKPDISFSEVAGDIAAILSTGRLTSGKYVAEFERLFAEYVGTKYAVTATSATTALHMALVGMGVGPGDEVLVSDFTFPASGNAIVQTGAVPVLVDNVVGRFEIDWDSARRKVNPRTKGIMVVHPFGQPLRPEDISRFSSATGLWVLEDAACAIASSVGNVRCGAMGNAACFSFHPRKILTTGEGGMITTNSDELYDRLTTLRNHGGRPASIGFQFVENGYNYRMNEIQAALGLAQLKRIDDIVEERRRVAKIYLRQFEEISFATVPLPSGGQVCSFQSFVVMLDHTVDRNAVIRRMKEKGVETTLGTYAMHAHPAFSRFGYSEGDLPNSLNAQKQSLTLPLIKGMDEDDCRAVVRALQSSI